MHSFFLFKKLIFRFFRDPAINLQTLALGIYHKTVALYILPVIILPSHIIVLKKSLMLLHKGNRFSLFYWK